MTHFVLIAGPLIILSLLLDPLVHAIATVPKPSVEGSDSYQVFRQAGSLLPWLFAVAAIAGHQVWRSRWRRERSISVAGLLILTIVLAGGIAELGKRLLGKERPGPDAEITFKPFMSAWLDDSNLGMPSSHAAVAFAAAFCLMRLFPGTGPALVLLAIGTGITRILVGAHFFSDVVAGAVIAYATAWLVVPRAAPQLTELVR